jgi:hypothetical protein
MCSDMIKIIYRENIINSRLIELQKVRIEFKEKILATQWTPCLVTKEVILDSSLYRLKGFGPFKWWSKVPRTAICEEMKGVE